MRRLLERPGFFFLSIREGGQGKQRENQDTRMVDIVLNDTMPRLFRNGAN